MGAQKMATPRSGALQLMTIAHEWATNPQNTAET
jgi:hypothetical protein